MDFQMYEMIDDIKFQQKFYFTVFSVLMGKGVDEETVQNFTDSLCAEYAQKFVEENRIIFININKRAKFMNKISHACKKPGGRLFRAVYKELENFQMVVTTGDSFDLDNLSERMIED